MESMGRKPRCRRSFTAEFKAQIVDICRRGDRSVGQVAKDFDPAEFETGTRQEDLQNVARQAISAVRHSWGASVHGTRWYQIE
jgi:hypothetical protein